MESAAQASAWAPIKPQINTCVKTSYKPYCYHLFHVPTGKHYYGSRTARTKRAAHPNELWVSYFSSSQRVHALREQYGDDSFIATVRKVFQTKEEALRWESRLLKRVNAKENGKWLNCHNGDGKFTNKSGFSAHNKGMSGPPCPWKGKSIWSEDRRAYFREIAKRENLPTDRRLRMSVAKQKHNNPSYRCRWMNKNGDHIRVHQQLVSEKIANGWKLGRVIVRNKDTGCFDVRN